jgi:hypothetical protein
MSAGPGIVFTVGMGEVGGRVSGALTTAGIEVRPVTRAAGWGEALEARDAALLVCVREEALPEVLARLQVVPPQRLAFLQNGWIRPLLTGFVGCTRGLVWFTSKGDFFRVLRPSVFSGPLAGFLADVLGRGGIQAIAVDDRAFAAAEAEKMGFNCVVGLPLAVHGLSLSDYLARHRDEAQAVFEEGVRTTAEALGTAPPPGAWEAFVESTEPIGWVRASIAKALEYRNGAVARLAREAGSRAPVNERLLAAAGRPV